jgi:hypothetical protein
MRKALIAGRLLFAACAAMAALPALAEAGDVFYVDTRNSSSNQDGLSWDTAYDTIQEGIERARLSFGGEVWVARGTYAETRDNENGSVLMRPGVDVYGGFRGNETRRNQRDPIANPTVIDGSKARNGSPASPVVDAANNTVLDGFTIQGGRGEAGPGLICVNESPVIRNCIFRDNESVEFGGAVMNINGGAPRFINCVFTENRAGTSGGAVGNTATSAEFIGCTFTLNHATAAGGAIFNTPGSPVIVRNCRFERNTAIVGGGAIFNEGAEPSIDASMFIANSTDGFGGAIFNNRAADVDRAADCLVVNSVLARNTAGRGGGAIANQQSTFTGINCTIVGNTGPRDFGGAFFNNGAHTEVLNSIIWYNSDEWIVNLSGSYTQIRWSNVGGGDRGPNNIAAEPRFVNRAEDDYRLRPDSPSIDAGSPNGAPEVDLAGIRRPQFDGIDQGAYESTARETPSGGMECHGGGDDAPKSLLTADAATGAITILLLVLASRRRRA